MIATSADEASLLRSGCDELSVVLAEAQQQRLLRFVDHIYVWNKTAGLTTIRRQDAVRLHVLDSLSALPVVGEGPCADLGSGAGLPGLVLAIARPSLDVTLVESNRKKCSFLHEAIRDLSLANARVFEGDARKLPDRYSTVISRAFRPPPEFVRIALASVTQAGRIVLMLADATDAEIEALRPGGTSIEGVRRLRLPGGGEPRTIVTLGRDCST